MVAMEKLRLSGLLLRAPKNLFFNRADIFYLFSCGVPAYQFTVL